MGGIFGDMFDINKDGKIDTFEQAIEIAVLVDSEIEANKRIAKKKAQRNSDDD